MTDWRFKYHTPGLESPGVGLVAVTPDDDNDITNGPIRAFRVGTTAGDVAVVDTAGNTVTIPNVQVAETVVLLVKRIKATGTTAEGITGFY